MREGYARIESNEMIARAYVNLDREQDRKNKITISVLEDDGLVHGIYLICDHDVETKGLIHWMPHWIDQLDVQGHMDVRLHVQGGLDHDVYEGGADCLGDAYKKAFGNKLGIKRGGYSIWNMEGVRAVLSLDLPGRPNYSGETKIKNYVLNEMIHHFLNNLAYHMGMDLQYEVEITNKLRANDHHKAEAIFKALAKALDEARIIHPLSTGQIPSTKDTIA